eukprot:177763-Pyramimonas_sp.AAC.1
MGVLQRSQARDCQQSLLTETPTTVVQLRRHTYDAARRRGVGLDRQGLPRSGCAEHGDGWSD